MQVGSRFRGRTHRQVYIGLLGLLVIAIPALVVFSSIWTYRHVKERIEGELEGRLLSVGQAIGAGLLPVFAEIAEGRGPQRRIQEEAGLRRIAETSGLMAIEVIDSNRRHILGANASTDFGEVNPLRAAQPEVAAALAGIPAATPLYEVPGIQGLFLKTGFAPIEDADGNILGVVAVEGGTGFFEIIPALRSIWWITGIISLVLALLLALLLLGVFGALERLERGMRATAALSTAGQLAAVVAHEVRNPLAALQSRAERVQEELASGTPASDVIPLLDAIPGEVRRLSRILSNYLSLARPPEGEGSCAVAAVVEETLDLVAKDLERAGIRSDFAFESRDLRARIAAGPLRQAMLNLFLNARDAIGADGEIHIRLASREKQVHLEIEDTGRGMDHDERKRIFEPFYTTRSGGSGLGLAVVDSVVRTCGGRIDVASTPGRGTRFVLILPRDERESEDE